MINLNFKKSAGVNPVGIVNDNVYRYYFFCGVVSMITIFTIISTVYITKDILNYFKKCK